MATIEKPDTTQVNATNAKTKTIIAKRLWIRWTTIIYLRELLIALDN